jgi:hypothetical protein
VAMELLCWEGCALGVRGGKAWCKPGHVTVTGSLATARWSQGGEIRVSVMPSFRACGARPSATRPTATRVALRGRPWGNAESGFLGGTHSVRPHCKAVRKPRHIMITGGK